MEAREMLERMAAIYGATCHDTGRPGETPNRDNFKSNKKGLESMQAALRELAKEHYDDVGGWHTPCALGSMVFAIMELEL